MQVKNISSSEIKIEDLGIKLGPGDVADLSSHDPATLRVHTKLNLYFNKGLLMNLGPSRPVGSKAALVSARDKIEKLNVLGKNNVLKQAKKTALDNKKRITDVLRESDHNKRVSAPSKNFLPEKERYRDEFFYNNPSMDYEEEEDLPKPKPKVKIQDKFQPGAINSESNVTFGSNGRIETGILTGKTTQLSLSAEELDDMGEQLTIIDRSGKEHKISFEEVKEKMLRKCIGMTSRGKPCKKYAIHGFQSCLKHMSRSELAEYHSKNNK